MTSYSILFVTSIALLASCRTSRINEDSLTSSGHQETNFSVISAIDLGASQRLMSTRDIFAAMMDSALTSVALDVAWHGENGEIHYTRNTKSGGSSQSRGLEEVSRTDTALVFFDSRKILISEKDERVKSNSRVEEQRDSHLPDFAKYRSIIIALLLLCAAVRVYLAREELGEAFRKIFRRK